MHVLGIRPEDATLTGIAVTTSVSRERSTLGEQLLRCPKNGAPQFSLRPQIPDWTFAAVSARTSPGLRCLALAVLVTLVAFADNAAGQSAVPLSSPKAKPLIHEPLDKQLRALLLPQVNFRDATFLGALQCFARKAEQQSEGTVKVPFLLELPDDFKPRCELTLDLNMIPFMDALRCLGELAGVEFSFQADSLIVRVPGEIGAAASVIQNKAFHIGTPLPAKGIAGILGKSAVATNGQPTNLGNPRRQNRICFPSFDGGMVHPAGFKEQTRRELSTRVNMSWSMRMRHLFLCSPVTL
jgi:hypothetical protein